MYILSNCFVISGKNTFKFLREMSNNSKECKIKKSEILLLFNFLTYWCSNDSTAVQLSPQSCSFSCFSCFSAPKPSFCPQISLSTLPPQPVIPSKKPFKVELSAGKRYSWCSCGLSRKQVKHLEVQKVQIPFVL